MSTESKDGNWIPVTSGLPPENQVVQTISDGGLQQDLKRRGSLYFFPDDSMYVYYRVAYWRAK